MAPAPRSTARYRAALASVAALALTACQGTVASEPEEQPGAASGGSVGRDAGPTSVVTLAFAGDIHFQLHLAGLLEQAGGGLGPIDQALSSADVTMVNLESADHRARHPGPEGARGPGTAATASAPRPPHWTSSMPRGWTWSTHGQQPRRRLRERRPAGHAARGARCPGRRRRSRDGPAAPRSRPTATTVRGTDIAFLAADGIAARGPQRQLGGRPARRRASRPPATASPARCSPRSARPPSGRRGRGLPALGREYRSCPTRAAAPDCARRWPQAGSRRGRRQPRTRPARDGVERRARTWDYGLGNFALVPQP